MKKIATILAMLCVAVSAQQKDSFTDPRDGKTYKTVKISNQTWMAENLNYAGKVDGCYAEKPENCKKYGALYNWSDAKESCPSGWHLPSQKEWKTLIAFAGGDEIAGKKLKAKSGWSNSERKPSNGTDEFGFAALPGGLYEEEFIGAGENGMWWTANEMGKPDSEDYERYGSYANIIFLDERIGSGSIYKFSYLSVRCLKD